jgi:uncharacterized lipoprotein YddW (UPF0748 family)
MSRRNGFIAALLLLISLAPAALADGPPALRREFRGVWIASVSNIDWPSRKGLSAEQQQAELRAILDKAAALKLNVVILQVRPMCDALYESKLEPWSEFLTGTLGKDPGYDPLAFAIREAHARGLELHAWFNPYRAHHPSATSPIPAEHIVKKRPDLAKKYGKHYWLNPTHPEVAEHSLKVVLDVVKRYDIDGIHMDDYFYPYPEKDADGKPVPFPDDDTWAEYQKSGGKLSRDDWRREAVNRFVERLYREVKAAEPWVKVGISPFGIWRPGHPPGIQGFDQYDGLFADARKWLNEGWADYFTPQLYWPIKQEKQSYPKLLAWWAAENSKQRLLVPGNYTSRVTGEPKGWPAHEIADQVALTRAQKGARGNIHFSARALLQNTGGVADVLAAAYTDVALPPELPWLDDKPVPKPSLAGIFLGNEARVEPKVEGKPMRWFVFHALAGGKWKTVIKPVERDGTAYVSFKPEPRTIVITAVDRVGKESPAVTMTRTE